MLAHMERKADAQSATIRKQYAQADQNIGKALQNLQRAESELRRGSHRAQCCALKFSGAARHEP